MTKTSLYLYLYFLFNYLENIFCSKQLNPKGFPTVEGLVALYTEGINQKEYILATLQAVNKCIGKAQKEFLTVPQSIDRKYNNHVIFFVY